MLLLLETPAGFGLFRLNDKKLVEDPESIYEKAFSTKEKAQAAVTLEGFSKFADTKAAMEACTDMMESKVGKQLKKFLKKRVVDAGLSEQLGVYDKALGQAIKAKFEIDCIHNAGVTEAMRGIRYQLHELVEGLDEKETETMALGLSHSLSRFKLKFSPDKVDTMIVQAIGLLDDIDKELNNFAMRLREWYGWHFPELAKIVTDNQAYAEVVLTMGFRTNAKTLELKSVPEEVLEEIKKSAEISMGTEMTEEDLATINDLAGRVLELSKYRVQLSEYLKQRMVALAPNLTAMVGELVGARLISQAGSLMNLAKAPSSTVQILGAEKALFRALKTKSNTPKYGLIYHASLVGQTAPKLKGKVSRILAAKMALSARVDALADNCDGALGEEAKEYVEKRIQMLETGTKMKLSKSSDKAKYTPPKVDSKSKTNTYNEDADAVEDEEGFELVAKPKKRKVAEVEAAEEAEEPKAKKSKKEKKEKKAKKAEADEE